MDGRRFDAWTQGLMPRLTSRRAALRGITWGAIGMLAGRHLDIASARKRKGKRKRKCKGDTKKCGKKCILKTQCCSASDCAADAACENGACVCPSGETVCGGSCVDLATDHANCGACGNVCSSGSCSSGNCSCTRNTDCPDGCSCGVRAQGGTVCREIGVLSEPCEGDSDCVEPGDFCLNSNFCTAPCRG
jgi:hypothetical protein